MNIITIDSPANGQVSLDVDTYQVTGIAFLIAYCTPMPGYIGVGLLAPYEIQAKACQAVALKVSTDRSPASARWPYDNTTVRDYFVPYVLYHVRNLAFPGIDEAAQELRAWTTLLSGLPCHTAAPLRSLEDSHPVLESIVALHQVQQLIETLPYPVVEQCIEWFMQNRNVLQIDNLRSVFGR